MSPLAVILVSALISLLLMQLPFLINFIRIIRQHLAQGHPAPEPSDAPKPEYLPKATVILCMRGADPFLPDCLQGLLAQDYPHYQLRIVIDSPDDPAWEVLGNTLPPDTTTPVKVSALTQRLSTCCLKCSSLIQAVSDLEADSEVVAILDADVVPHPTYLRELVAPLANPHIGVASGNRWYTPGKGAWGSVVRYVFNVPAVMQMTAYKMPFGGALAFKADILQNSPLLERWSHSLTDTPVLAGVFREQGLGVAFVPSLMMANLEDCQLPNCIRWMKRQLLMVRLYHPATKWWAIIAYSTIISLVPALSIGLLITSAVTARWQVFGAIAKEGGALQEFREVNVQGVVTMAQAAKASGVRVFVHLSSVMVYGFNYPEQVGEAGLLCSEGNPYCQTKIEAEQALWQLHDPPNFNVIMIRAGDVYGPGSIPWTIRPLLLMQQRLFFLPNRGQGLINHLYIDNLVDAIFLSLEQETYGEVFNITDGQHTSWHVFFRKLAAVAQLSPPRSLPAHLLKNLIRLRCAYQRAWGKVPDLLPESIDFITRAQSYSTAKAQSQIGFQPRIDLDTGMEHIQAWLCQTDFRKLQWKSDYAL